MNVSSPSRLLRKVLNLLENELEIADNVIKHILRIVLEDFGLGLWQRQSEICQLIPSGP
jgi:hypothetical protein